MDDYLHRINRKEQVRDVSGSVLWTSVMAWTPMSATRNTEHMQGTHTLTYFPLLVGYDEGKLIFLPRKKSRTF